MLYLWIIFRNESGKQVEILNTADESLTNIVSFFDLIFTFNPEQGNLQGMIKSIKMSNIFEIIFDYQFETDGPDGEDGMHPKIIEHVLILSVWGCSQSVVWNSSLQ